MKTKISKLETGRSFFIDGVMYMRAKQNYNSFDIVPNCIEWENYVLAFCFHSGIIELFHPDTIVNNKMR
jgi:hypothetical protein